jgi:hypothetical protein
MNLQDYDAIITIMYKAQRQLHEARSVLMGLDVESESDSAISLSLADAQTALSKCVAYALEAEREELRR